MGGDIGEGIAADIMAWDAIGGHRTGTAGDRRTSNWLADEARALGCSPMRDDFALSRWVPGRSAVEVAGTVLEGVPLFDGGTTGAEGVTGRLVPLDDDRVDPDGSTIGLGSFGNAAGSATAALGEARRSAPHDALVAVSKMSPRVPGLALQNADSFRNPFGPPVLQVATEHETLLQAAAARNETVRVTADVTVESATASNVRCRVPGEDPSLPPLVVMTPKSAWWVCTAERGGGIAVWLALLRRYAANAANPANKPKRDILFIATSGHELGHLGLDHFLADSPPLGARAWIHLGANFAALGSQVRLQASDRQFLDLARTALASAGTRADAETPLGERPGGEARNVHDLGERYISFLGSNDWFHHPEDRWPTTLDLPRTRRIAAAVLTITHLL